MSRVTAALLALGAVLATPAARAGDTPSASAAAKVAAPAAAASKQGIPEKLSSKEIPDYQRVDKDLAVAGQPSQEALARLQEMGFRTVLSLRVESEGPDTEQAVVEQQGLGFVRVPVTAESLSSADADAVAAVLADPEKAPVLLHCGASQRVGAVLAVLEARRGKSADDAVAVGRSRGMTSPQLVEAARRVIAAEQKK